MENNSKHKPFSILPVTCHTDFVKEGSTFIAISGMQSDGINFIPQALQKGATTIVIEEGVKLSEKTNNLITLHNATLIYVPNTRKALADLSAQAFKYPTEKLKIIGITGTKGKTTSAWLMEHVLKTAGYTTALISTVCNKIGSTVFATNLTTPQPDYLQAFLYECAQKKIDYVIIEAAAQAFTLHRLDHIRFDRALFTNFSQEHGEFYTTQRDYLEAKLQIMTHLKEDGQAFFNADDETLLATLHTKYRSYGIKNKHAHSIASSVVTSQQGISFEVNNFSFLTEKLFGLYNVYNALGIIAIAQSLNVSNHDINKALQTFPGIPGRMQETVKKNGVRFIIDYAHNPASFKAVLSTLKKRTEHLIVIFGAGGERDHERRPTMGAIASEYADTIILTTDNPRSEDPERICAEIKAGIKLKNLDNIAIELDRKKAIETAYKLAQPNTIIALLGKGPDEYQLLGAKKLPFSEQEIIYSL